MRKSRILLGVGIFFIVLWLALHLFLTSPIYYSLLSSKAAEPVALYLNDNGDLPLELSLREEIHMKDVKNIFSTMDAVIGIVALLASIGAIIVLTRKKDLSKIFSDVFNVAGILTFVTSVLLLIGAVFFRFAFVGMHKLLFSNDYWILSHDSLLIRLFPESFFVAMVLTLLLYTLIISSILFVSGRALRVKNGSHIRKRRNKKKA